MVPLWSLNDDRRRSGGTSFVDIALRGTAAAARRGHRHHHHHQRRQQRQLNGRWTDGRTDGRTDGWTVKRTKKRQWRRERWPFDVSQAT